MIRLLAFAIFLTLTCSAPSVAQVSDKSVCEGATIPGPSWATDNPLSPWFPWLKEAAKRGLTCGVRRENPYTKFLREEAAAALELAKAAERLAGLEPTDLCNKSVNSTTGEWDVRDEWKPYTDEAKRRGLTCEDRKAEVRQQLAAAGAERDRKTKAKRQADLLALQTNPMTVALAEEVALSLPFELSLVPQMNDLMLCVQGKFRKNNVLSAEISKRGIRCGKLLELMR